MKIKPSAWGIAMVACLPCLAAAQPARIEAPRVVPQLTYRSAFADYKPYQDAPLANWRKVNDTVAGAPGGASGHAGHGMGGMKDMEGVERPRTAASAASTPMPMKPQMRMPIRDGQDKQGGKP